MRSCRWGEGEGGGRKRKTEGKKASPRPMARREQEKPCECGPMSRGERLRLGPKPGARGLGDAPGPTLTPGFPVPRGFTRRREGGEMKSRSDVCGEKPLPAPNPYLFLPKLLGLIEAPDLESF